MLMNFHLLFLLTNHLSSIQNPRSSFEAAAKYFVVIREAISQTAWEGPGCKLQAINGIYIYIYVYINIYICVFMCM